jgi:hypothetical protein
MSNRTEQHCCIHEREFGELISTLAKITKDIYGNGQIGIAQTIPRLEEKINNLSNSVTYHTAVIANFIQFQGEHLGEKQQKKDDIEKDVIRRELTLTKKRDRRQFFFWVIAAIVAVLSLWVVLYKTFDNGDKLNTVKAGVDTVKTESVKK